MVAPPRDEVELLERARALAGRSLEELGALGRRPVPRDLRRAKGWTGQLLETLLGATAGSLAEPDFPHLGVELKTLPVGRDGLPRETTYVCTVALSGECGSTWAASRVRRKLARVLWIPVESEPSVPPGERRLGSPLLWSPEPETDAALKTDWEELMETLCVGGVARLSAALGTYLQIRPKAAHSRILRPVTGEDGDLTLTVPRGFYLRTSFTRALLRCHYAGPTPKESWSCR